MDASKKYMKKHLSIGLMWVACMLLSLPVSGQEEWSYTQNWFQTGYYERPENVVASRVPQSLSEAVQLLPPIPSVEQVMSPTAKKRVAASTYEPFSLAVEQAMTQYIDANIIIQRRINAARFKMAKALADSLYQPDPRDARFDEIAQEIENLDAVLNSVVQAYNGMGAGGYASHTHSPAFDKLLAELRHDWYTCDEAKRVEEIEDDLDIRIEKWTASLTDNVRNEVPFPLWWEAERRKENVYIDQWNRRAAERWLKVAQDGEKNIKGVFEKLAALETENDQLALQGDPEHVVYLTNKLRLNNYMPQLYRITEPYQDALWFPCIEHVVTSGAARLK